MPYVEGKKCCKCLVVLPYDAFSVAGKKVHTCKSCEGHLELKAAHEEQRTAEAWAVSRIMESVKQGYEVPDTEEYLFELYKAFGGPKGVSRLHRKVFDDAKPGSMIQSRILEHIGKVQIKVSQQKQELDLATMTREELEERIRARMVNLYKEVNAEFRPALPSSEHSGGRLDAPDGSGRTEGDGGSPGGDGGGSPQSLRAEDGTSPLS